jgi:hypothetical protein
MTVIAVTSANVGTKLATVSDTHIVSITVNQPAGQGDDRTPFVLADAAAAPVTGTAPLRTLFSATISALASIFATKPAMPFVTGITAPVWPMSLGAAMNNTFLNGVWVVSCPTGLTFNVTTG